MEEHSVRGGTRKKRGTGLKKLTVIMLCLVFFISGIYITDMSTKNMMLCKDDKHAIGLYKEGRDTMRVDLAGERYMLSYKEVKDMTGILIKESERVIKSTVEKFKR